MVGFKKKVQENKINPTVSVHAGFNLRFNPLRPKTWHSRMTSLVMLNFGLITISNCVVLKPIYSMFSPQSNHDKLLSV
jgi:hypothetical protein